MQAVKKPTNIVDINERLGCVPEIGACIKLVDNELLVVRKAWAVVGIAVLSAILPVEVFGVVVAMTMLPMPACEVTVVVSAFMDVRVVVSAEAATVVTVCAGVPLVVVVCGVVTKPVLLAAPSEMSAVVSVSVVVV